MRHRLGIWLHGLSLRLNPQIAHATHLIIRDQTIRELAAQHHLTQAQAQLNQYQQQAAQRAANQ